RGERDRYPALRVREQYEEALLRQPIPELSAWTAALLRRLVHLPRYRRYALDLPPSSDGGPPEPGVLREQWESGARLLCEFLAQSGEYASSLELQRQDPALDPVMDFLLNVKQGHCERYAAALTLMLRSQDIPARVVKGFRGADHLGDGAYVVRQSQAH